MSTDSSPLPIPDPAPAVVPSLPTLRLNADWPAVQVIYQDEVLFAVNKPAGLSISPDRWDKEKDFLMGLLFDGIARQRPWAVELGLNYLANAHRLDKGTSGILLMARTKPTLVTLARAFQDRDVHKLYFVLVEGRPPADEMEIDFPIAPHPVRPGLSVTGGAHAKPALTRIRLVEKWRRYSLLEAEPLTGRQHQIRVHLQTVGSPVVADRQYGTGQTLLLSKLKKNYRFKENEPERPLIGRPALHAARVTFPHPTSGQAMTLEAPLPKDFTLALKYLRRFG
jgi:RluA family pseudouridine synthase